MDGLKSYLELLSKRQLESILSSPAIREGFAADTSRELGIPVDDILSHLETIKPTPISVKVIKSKPVNINLWDIGDSYRQRERKGILMNHMYRILESNNGGMTMTDLLKILNKDNGHWRPIAKSILDYMDSRGSIVKVGSKIYLKNLNLHRESEFHRQVFNEIITNGPISTSTILNNLKYRNKMGYAKIRPILNMMVNEGFIILKSRWWSVNE